MAAARPTSALARRGSLAVPVTVGLGIVASYQASHKRNNVPAPGAPPRRAAEPSPEGDADKPASDEATAAASMPQQLAVKAALVGAAGLCAYWSAPLLWAAASEALKDRMEDLRRASLAPELQHRSTRLRALRQQLSAESREHWEAQLGSSLRAVVPGRNSLAFEQALIRCQDDPLVCPHELGFMRLRAGGPETPVAVEFNHRHAAAPPAQLGGGGVRPMRVGIPAALAESQGIIEGAIVVVCVAGVSIAGAATLLPASPYVTLPLEAIEALLAAGLGFRMWD